MVGIEGERGLIKSFLAIFIKFSDETEGPTKFNPPPPPPNWLLYTLLTSDMSKSNMGVILY